MLIRCLENATEYSNLTGKELDKTTTYAFSKCQDILKNYKLIPEGMMPYEEEIKELKKNKEIKKKNYYQNNINKGPMGSEELDWEKE